MATRSASNPIIAGRDLRDHQQATFWQAIDEDAGGYAQDECRPELADADQPERGRRIGQGKNQPTLGQFCTQVPVSEKSWLNQKAR